MTENEAIILEMEYTTFEDSCGDSVITEAGELRQCRRSRGHRNRDSPLHASNYPLYFW